MGQLCILSISFSTFACLSLSAIILKMARLTKDVSIRGQKADSVSKAPSKTLIIPGKEVVQVIAKVLLLFPALKFCCLIGFKLVKFGFKWNA